MDKKHGFLCISTQNFIYRSRVRRGRSKLRRGPSAGHLHPLHQLCGDVPAGGDVIHAGAAATRRIPYRVLCHVSALQFGLLCSRRSVPVST